ncbi:MAG: DUF2911 domain-containing protein, partial [Rhodothermales bacterium]|nr:DUF2911 domain-containing protein [Rhodothermales bacterium]
MLRLQLIAVSILLLTTSTYCGDGTSVESTASNQPTDTEAFGTATYDTATVVPPPLARKSPIAVARTEISGTYVKIVFGAPQKRGRVVFGALEPFGQIWRLGANETTEITTTDRLSFGGLDLEAGTYALFAIPEPDKWTIIVNAGLGQWGAYDYDESLDIGRFEV